MSYMLLIESVSLAGALGHYPVHLSDNALGVHEPADLLQEGPHLIDQNLALAWFSKINGLLKDIVGIRILHELHQIAVHIKIIVQSHKIESVCYGTLWVICG